MNEFDISLIQRLMERSVRNVIIELEAEHRNNLRDFSLAPDDEIMEYIYSVMHNSVYDTRQQLERRFYAGLTDSVLTNQRHHNIKDYLCCCRVKDFEQGCRLLAHLSARLGIYIGPLPAPETHPEILADYNILYLAQRNMPGFID